MDLIARQCVTIDPHLYFPHYLPSCALRILGQAILDGHLIKYLRAKRLQLAATHYLLFYSQNESVYSLTSMFAAIGPSLIPGLDQLFSRG